MTASTRKLVFISLFSSLSAFACETKTATPNDSGGGDASTNDAATQLCQAHAVTCVDQSLQQLPLHENVSDGMIVEEGTVAGEFLSNIDATGGGQAVTESFVYAKFTATGLAKVAIDDETALESTDWDIAFRRYVIRVNSGVSGPSCVQAGRTAPATVFENLTRVPANLTFRTEEYFSESRTGDSGTGDSGVASGCEFVPDGSGIGSPGTVLSSFWSYPGCVKMTGNIYVLQLADGRHVKLKVQSYYTPSVQEVCDNEDRLVTPSGAGAIRMRWAFVP